MFFKNTSREEVKFLLKYSIFGGSLVFAALQWLWDAADPYKAFQANLLEQSVASAPLTENEALLAKSVFGEAFNTSSIRKHYYDGIPKNSNMTPHTIAGIYPDAPDNMHFVSKFEQTADYGRAIPDKAGIFMHEMTHVWQHRGNRRDRAAACSIYEYKLKPQSRFADFCIEQQADIIKDYTMRFLVRPVDLNYAVTADYLNRSMTENEKFLVNVVETRFPHARKSRLNVMGLVQKVSACVDKVDLSDSFGTASYTRCNTMLTDMSGRRLTDADERHIAPPRLPKPVS